MMEYRCRRLKRNQGQDATDNPSRAQNASQGRSLDEKEFPAFLSHHVPPVDALELTSCRRRVVNVPNVFQEFVYSAKGAEIRCFHQGAHSAQRTWIGMVSAPPKQHQRRGAAIPKIGQSHPLQLE